MSTKENKENVRKERERERWGKREDIWKEGVWEFRGREMRILERKEERK